MSLGVCLRMTRLSRYMAKGHQTPSLSETNHGVEGKYRFQDLAIAGCGGNRRVDTTTEKEGKKKHGILIQQPRSRPRERTKGSGKFKL